MDNLCQLYLLVRDTCELAAYTKHVLADHNAHPLNDIHDSDPLQANYSEPHVAIAAAIYSNIQDARTMTERASTITDSSITGISVYTFMITNISAS